MPHGMKLLMIRKPAIIYLIDWENSAFIIIKRFSIAWE